MTTPTHIIVIQSKPPMKRTAEEQRILREYRAAQADAFAKIRERVAKDGQ